MNISSKKWKFIKKLYRYLVTICFDLIQSKSISVQPNKYRSYLVYNNCVLALVLELASVINYNPKWCHN